MEWINLVLEPTLNLFAVHYDWSVLVSMVAWAIIFGLTVESSDEPLSTGALVLMFGLFTPILLALAVILLPVIIVMVGVVGLATLLVYGIKKLKDKTLGEKK